MMDYLYRTLDKILPSHCLLCHGRIHHHSHVAQKNLCQGCQNDLPWLANHGQNCCICALPLATEPSIESAQTVCGECLQQPPAYDRCIAAFEYTNPVDKLIGRFKHHRDLLAGKLLADLFRQLPTNQFTIDTTPDFITAVPLHWKRQIGRGFNQSAFLAQQFATHLSNARFANLAERVRPTPTQQQLNRKARLRNLKDAFVVERKKVSGKSIVLVDDVVTTGATAEALSRQFKKAGAIRVEVWCLARTPKGGF